MKKIKYLSASWCGPCKMLSPVIDELISEGFNIEKIDVDNNPEEVTTLGVRNIPTLVLIKESEFGSTILGKKIGVISKEEIKKWYNG